MEGDTQRGRTKPQLDRRAFVRLSSCSAGLIWATPRIRSSVAPAQAGTPPPTSAPPATSPTSEPPEVASLVPPAEVAAAPAGAPEVHARVTGVRDPLAVTGTEIGQMTALGVGAVAGGLALRHVGERLKADPLELCPPDAGSPGAQPG